MRRRDRKKLLYGANGKKLFDVNFITIN